MNKKELYDKNKDELLKMYGEVTGLEERWTPYIELLVTTKSLEELEASLSKLEQSMSKSAKSNDDLGTKLFWLNVILTAATVAGTIIAALTYLCG